MIDQIALIAQAAGQAVPDKDHFQYYAAILVALISTTGAVMASIFSRSNGKKIKEMTSSNSGDHGRVVAAVKEMGHKLDRNTAQTDRLSNKVDAVSVEVGAVIATQRLAVFHSTPDGELISCNSAAMQLLGLSFSEIEKGFIHTVHKDDIDRVKRHWEEALHTKRQAPTIRYRYVHPQTKAVTLVDATISPILDNDGEVSEWLSVIAPVRLPGERLTAAI